MYYTVFVVWGVLTLYVARCRQNHVVFYHAWTISGKQVKLSVYRVLVK